MCGGTPAGALLGDVQEGLSPRVRGNRLRVILIIVSGRTIPACAGEPGASDVGPPESWDYPRVCGGTRGKLFQEPFHPGLSPRVRGNRTMKPPWKMPGGTIPACAGEPSRTTQKAWPTRDYPRVCGGTDYSDISTDPFMGLSPRVRGNPGGVGMKQSR